MLTTIWNITSSESYMSRRVWTFAFFIKKVILPVASPRGYITTKKPHVLTRKEVHRKQPRLIKLSNFTGFVLSLFLIKNDKNFIMIFCCVFVFVKISQKAYTSSQSCVLLYVIHINSYIRTCSINQGQSK